MHAKLRIDLSTGTRAALEKLVYKKSRAVNGATAEKNETQTVWYALSRRRGVVLRLTLREKPNESAAVLTR